jgi:hypothetical protein
MDTPHDRFDELLDKDRFALLAIVRPRGSSRDGRRMPMPSDGDPARGAGS